MRAWVLSAAAAAAVTLAAGGASAAIVVTGPLEDGTPIAPFIFYDDEPTFTAAVSEVVDESVSPEWSYGVGISLPETVDAFGVNFFWNPSDFSGSSASVFVGLGNSETGQSWQAEFTLAASPYAPGFFGVTSSNTGDEFDSVYIDIFNLSYSLDITEITYGTALPVAPVPLPASALLLGAALAGLGLVRWRA